MHNFMFEGAFRVNEICSAIFIPKILAVSKVAFLGSKSSIDVALFWGAESDERRITQR